MNERLIHAHLSWHDFLLGAALAALFTLLRDLTHVHRALGAIADIGDSLVSSLEQVADTQLAQPERVFTAGAATPEPDPELLDRLEIDGERLHPDRNGTDSAGDQAETVNPDARVE